MTHSQKLRYSRQLRLPEVGVEGQRRLAEASVLVVGAGGLGTPALHHLAASGVGRLGIVEFDTVDLSNIHRQTLYSSDDVGQPKLEAAVRRLRKINPEVEVIAHAERLDASNADRLVGAYDLVLDGSDTFATRYAVNDASASTGVPVVYASVDQFSGQASVLGAPGGPCYRCLFPEPPPAGLIPNCEDGGVLGVVPSILGTIQATEALKMLLGVGRPLVGRLLLFDALAMETREIGFAKDPDCPACGASRSAFVPETSDDAAVEVTASEVRSFSDDSFEWLDVREPDERRDGDPEGFHIPLGQLADRAGDLDGAQGRPLVVYCASGVRSAQAARQLRSRGFDARSLRGGVASWNVLDAITDVSP